MNKNLLPALLVVALVVGLGIGYAGAGAFPAGSTTPKPATITMVSEGHEGGSLASDGKTHDTIMPASFTVYVGQQVNLTVINYDEGPHTITSPTLGINFQFPGAKAAGVPSVTSFTFTATKAGSYLWYCALPCDKGQGGWAMTQGANGSPAQIGFMAGYITVLGA